MQTLRQLVLASGFKMRRKVFTQTFCQEKYKRYSTTPPGVKAEQQFSIPKGILGQPTCHTHPHMIGPGQLTCGITQAEYRERRETLVAKLLAESQDAHKNHIIVIPAACKQYMSDKIPYTFRQNSDFYYLTGCLEPSAVLVILKTPQTEDFKEFKHNLNMASAEPESGHWLRALPSASVGTLLDRNTFNLSVCLRLGCKTNEPHRVDQLGHHGLLSAECRPITPPRGP
ncbi:unnamed protein product [Plutella xylostella]|uniref:(diamondback moth) hypothetical protein n=1 Tax=Plutella xylostella TaxID=51655 RepID=A0A8S4E3N4_PLUXY|nr:unnamed protein product [Plutella xylostella]